MLWSIGAQGFWRDRFTWFCAWFLGTDDDLEDVGDGDGIPVHNASLNHLRSARIGDSLQNTGLYSSVLQAAASPLCTNFPLSKLSIGRCRSFPTTHILTSPNVPIGNILSPNWPRLSRGGMYGFTHKRRGSLSISPTTFSRIRHPIDYEACGWNALALVAPLPKNDSVIWAADAGIIKQMVNDRVLFPKPLEVYEAINFYGRVSACAPFEKKSNFLTCRKERRRYGGRGMETSSKSFTTCFLRGKSSCECGSTAHFGIREIINSFGMRLQIPWTSYSKMFGGHRKLKFAWIMSWM